MEEVRQQRWASGLVAAGAAILSVLQFRDIPHDERLLGGVLLVSGALVGFGAMSLRERHLSKTGKVPLDTPTPSVMVSLVLVLVGLLGLIQLLDPTFRVLPYGLVVGSTSGLAAYIGSDIRRLRR
jgi:drug/metabolite transporter (DMT)-like permease